MKLDCQSLLRLHYGGRSDLVALVDGEELAVGDELRMVYSRFIDQAKVSGRLVGFASGCDRADWRFEWLSLWCRYALLF